ncbi:glutamine amidotransferase class-I [Klebsiella pneumoniae]|nr:glutamine amidotransferase class-I [Klebsiella pneumoniae]
MRVHFIVHESFEAPGAYWTAPQKLDTQLSKVQFYG